MQSGTNYTAYYATDGDPGTRWSSAPSDPQWLEVDLGAQQQICSVSLLWEAAYATAFQIQVSNGNATWTTVYSTTTGTGGNQTLTISATDRCIRMYGTVRRPSSAIRSLSSTSTHGSGAQLFAAGAPPAG